MWHHVVRNCEILMEIPLPNLFASPGESLPQGQYTTAAKEIERQSPPVAPSPSKQKPVGRMIQYNTCLLRVCLTSAEDNSCAFHALFGEKDSRGMYHCPSEDGQPPRERFIKELQEIPRDDRDSSTSKSEVRTYYLAVVLEFVTNIEKITDSSSGSSILAHDKSAHNKSLQYIFRQMPSNTTANLYAEWKDLSGKSEPVKEKFLLGDIVFNAYLAYVRRSEYYFSDGEIMLRASMYNMDVLILTENPDKTNVKRIVRANYYLPNNAEAKVVYIWHRGDHFSRCELVENSNAVDDCCQKVEDCSTTIFSWIITSLACSTIIVLLGLVYMCLFGRAQNRN